MLQTDRSTLVFLHSLGSSRREWDGVVKRLQDDFETLALDLPGFGDRSAEGYADVEAALDDLCARIADRRLGSWIIVGHSMGGKFATLIAARAGEGRAGLSGLVGVVLVAGSPPSPEPMDEDRRRQMLTWFDDAAAIEDKARRFVDDNTDHGLPVEADRQAVADFTRQSPQAWRGWLFKGTREDWSERAGIVPFSALIVAGAEDGDLGEEAQRRLNAPHFRSVDIVVVPRAAHLIPQEQPDELASAIRSFGLRVSASALPSPLVALMASDRVSDRTRQAMMDRRIGPAEPGRGALTSAQQSLLAAIVDRILPGAAEPADLARRLSFGLAKAAGDGWRFADLPPDAEAWARGLNTLASAVPDFERLPKDHKDRLLRQISQVGFAGSDGSERLSADGMRMWFEDMASETAKLWMSLPATWADIGYDGFATGGDGKAQGYVETAADVSEPWRLPRGGAR